jgi:hypothetical protein
MIVSNTYEESFGVRNRSHTSRICKTWESPPAVLCRGGNMKDTCSMVWSTGMRIGCDVETAALLVDLRIALFGIKATIQGSGQDSVLVVSHDGVGLR